MGWSAPTRQCRRPRITDLAGGTRPDNVAQVLREAPRGTRSVVRHVEEVMQISDQHVAKLYRRQATAFLRTDRRRLCLTIMTRDAAMYRQGVGAAAGV
jgi:hypothetical protein